MKKQVADLAGVKKPSTGFNHVIKAGNFIFLSSQLSVDLRTGEIIRGNIKEQTRRAMENVKHLLPSVTAQWMIL